MWVVPDLFVLFLVLIWSLLHLSIHSLLAPISLQSFPSFFPSPSLASSFSCPSPQPLSPFLPYSHPSCSSDLVISSPSQLLPFPFLQSLQPTHIIFFHFSFLFLLLKFPLDQGMLPPPSLLPCLKCACERSSSATVFTELSRSLSPYRQINFWLPSLFLLHLTNYLSFRLGECFILPNLIAQLGCLRERHCQVDTGLLMTSFERGAKMIVVLLSLCLGGLKLELQICVFLCSMRNYVM